MKKSTSQVFVAVVCGLLGFLLAYQFKVLAKQNKQESNAINNDIIAEIESLKEEKEELSKVNVSLAEDLKKLEESASKEGEVGAEIMNQLNTARMQLGLVDVKGPGIVVTITPKVQMFSAGSSENGRKVSEEELVHLVNSLWFATAEAISINDMRITPQTGIKPANQWIQIGLEGRVDPGKPIVIKAIGDKVRLNQAIEFQNTKKYGALDNYDVDTKQNDEIIINKTAQSLSSEYIIPVIE